VVRSRDSLQLRASSGKKPTSAPLALAHPTNWQGWSFRPIEAAVADDAWAAWLPTDRPLVIRSWGPGDAMGTRRSGRARKVKRLLSDAGVTGHLRQLWPVVVAEDGGEIVWVPGVRRSDAASDPDGRSGLSFVCEYVNR
jgi:tRNA(Ile)-lysidine synthetase-like protein